MRSGVLHVPLSDAATPVQPPAVRGIRVRRSRMASTPLTQPFVVIAGPPRAGKSALVNALVEAPGLAPVDAPATTSAWLVLRHGEPGAQAFIPGHREPRTFGLEGIRTGDTAAAGRGGQSRPPRRIEVSHPAPLQAHVAQL